MSNNYTSPMTKPKIGAKPSFALKPMTLKKQGGPPLQTPVKYDGNGFSAAQQNMGSADEEIKTSPPEQQYGTGLPTSTPPPGPGLSRIQGQKQFAKPMKIQKKRFVMAAPDRQEQIPDVNKPAAKLNSQFLQSPSGNAEYPGAGSAQRENSANRLTNNLSRGSLNSQSAQRLVEEKHLGPQIMKQKVGTAVAYNQWNQGPLPHGNQAQMLQGASNQQQLNAEKQNAAISKMNVGPNLRPASRMKANPGTQQQSFQSGFKISQNKSRMSHDNYSDDDYEEDFQEGADDGQDEMERIRNAMAREKQKADKFKERQQIHSKQKEDQQQTRLKFQGAQGHNPLKLNSNLDGFSKQKGLIIGEQVDHMAVNRQQVRAKELGDLLQLSSEECFNMFEMVPQTPQDIYRNKLQAEVIKTQVAATNDEMIEQEVQTDDLGSVSIGTQKPEEQNPEELLQRYVENQSKTQAIGLGKRKNVDLGNIKLQKFLDQSEPIMQKVIEENQLLHFKENRGEAANRNAVELKQNIKIPQEILYLFSEMDEEVKLAEVVKVSCIHTFESCPQSKCAIAYQIRRPHGKIINLAIVFSTLDLQHQNLVVCNDEITQMCTTGRADVLICATKLGSFFLFDLLNIDDSGVQGMELNFTAVLQFKKPDFVKYPPHIQQELLQKCQIKYHVQSYSYMTDGLETFPHESQIQKLCFINISDGGISKIGAIDKHGIISVWSVVEHLDIPNSMNYDLQVKSSSKFKMVPIFSDRLFDYPDCIDLFDEKSLQYVEIEFDPVDPQLYFFSTSLGLFKIHRNDEVRTEPQKMDTIGLNSPTALSLCDKGYLLAAFSCGSICLYDKNFTSPLTVWYQKAKCPITQIKWCQLYFDDEQAAGQSPEKKHGKMEYKDEPDNKTASKGEQFSARLCEFFAIDLSEDFSIWNLQKSTQKPAHVIQFSEKHSSHDVKRMFRISTTCWDQSFFTAFALKDFSVNLYLMNFKKGSSISKEKLNAENKKSLRVIKKLPQNMVTQHDSLGMLDFNDFDMGQIQEAPPG